MSPGWGLADAIEELGSIGGEVLTVVGLGLVVVGSTSVLLWAQPDSAPHATTGKANTAGSRRRNRSNTAHLHFRHLVDGAYPASAGINREARTPLPSRGPVISYPVLHVPSAG